MAACSLGTLGACRVHTCAHTCTYTLWMGTALQSWLGPPPHAQHPLACHSLLPQGRLPSPGSPLDVLAVPPASLGGVLSPLSPEKVWACGSLQDFGVLHARDAGRPLQLWGFSPGSISSTCRKPGKSKLITEVPLKRFGKNLWTEPTV